MMMMMVVMMIDDDDDDDDYDTGNRFGNIYDNPNIL